MESETTTWLEFPNGEKVIVEKILASEEKNTSKRAGPKSNKIIFMTRSLLQFHVPPAFFDFGDF